MKIILAGDLFLGGDLYNKDTSSAVNSDIFRDADKRIVNLEQPISENEHIADKCTLYTGIFATEQLKHLEISAVNLAHNHIQDKMDEGIIETIEHLDNADIGHFGAGQNILAARAPYWVDSTTCILGYCEFGRPYLKQIQVAGEDSPGINPLRYEAIMQDLSRLPPGKKAVLYFHWGREHVWLPPYHDIQLARKLLEDDRVALIVGMHCHRVQGYIEHNRKRAYMSLGNFLFPNFFIQPPTQIAYPDAIPDLYPITRQYHSVYRLTYKKWRLVNRISLMLEYDTENGRVHHIPVIQDDDVPMVQELHGIKGRIILLWVDILSLIYHLPRPPYTLLEKVNVFLFYRIWKFQIMLFHARERGLTYCGKLVCDRIKCRITEGFRI